MSITFISKRRRVKEKIYHCDGPRCQSKTDIMPAVYVEHGFTSPLEDTQQHFCSIACLKDWTLELKDPRQAR